MSKGGETQASPSRAVGSLAVPETEEPTSGEKHWWQRAWAMFVGLTVTLGAILGWVGNLFGFWTWAIDSGAAQFIGRQLGDLRVAWSTAGLLLLVVGMTSFLWRRTVSTKDASLSGLREQHAGELDTLGDQHAEELERKDAEITALAQQKDAEMAALRKQHAGELVETRKETLREKEAWDRRVNADIRLVPRLLGGLAQGGETREYLDRGHPDKNFRKEVMLSLDEISERWADATERIYDDELRQAMDDAKQALDEYWGTLAPQLDAPHEIDGRWYDLQVIRPPGGPWGSDHEEYYEFVRSVAPLRLALLDALRNVDRRLYDLRVEVGDLPH